MSELNNKPYVISADTTGLMNGWAERRAEVPSESYFAGMLAELARELGQYFESVEVVPEQALRRVLNSFIRNSSVPVVSLDRSYIQPGQKNLLGYLDMTRTVDGQLNSTGLGARSREIQVEDQLDRFARPQYGRAIALIDDVIFEGKQMLKVVEAFRTRGVAVPTVYAGVAIQEGIDLLQQNGVDVQVSPAWTYDGVIDEICERDFRVGVPFSGRTVVDGPQAGIQGAPYLYPFGKPVEWASLPEESALDFSFFCLSQAIEFWSKTEQLSRRNISTQEVAKPVYGLPQRSSMTAALREVLARVRSNEPVPSEEVI